MGKKIFILVILGFNILYGIEVFTSGSAVAKDRDEACKKALFQAQIEALQEASMKKFNNLLTDFQIKKIINNDIFSYVETISKKENIAFDFYNSYVTCRIKAKFNVDTSKLEAEKLSKLELKKKKTIKDLLIKKYNNVSTYVKDFFNGIKREYIVLNGTIHMFEEDGYSYNFKKNEKSASVSSFEYLVYIQDKYFFKLGLGKAKYKKIKRYYDGYLSSDETKDGYDIDYKYDFISVGISRFLFESYDGSKFSVDVDYVIPYYTNGYKKKYEYHEDENYETVEVLTKEDKINVSPFFNISFMGDFIVSENILLGMGIVIGGEKAWEKNFLIARLGIMF